MSWVAACVRSMAGVSWQCTLSNLSPLQSPRKEQDQEGNLVGRGSKKEWRSVLVCAAG